MDQRQRDACGGWSYFPTLPELPPDVDVLAEVMQVLLRAGRWTDVKAYAEPPLEVVLRDGVRPSGAVGTWILPSDQRSSLQARQGRFVASAWGDTEDVEVNANFLFALTLYDRLRFAEVSSAIGSFLIDRQEANGSWRSEWYVGPYYGTYVCTRALMPLGQHQALRRAREFLIHGQRADGGWGSGLVCNQLYRAGDLRVVLCSRSAGDRGVGSGGDSQSTGGAA